MGAAAATLKSSPAEKFRHGVDTRDWRPFITEGCLYRILDVNPEGRSAQMLMRFAPHAKCVFHRHTAVVSTLVLEGELRVWEQTGEGEVLKRKPAGSFSVGGRNEIHIEGGGDEGAVIFYHMQTESDVIYEILNPDLKLRRSITVADFERDWRESWPQDRGHCA